MGPLDDEELLDDSPLDELDELLDELLLELLDEDEDEDEDEELLLLDEDEDEDELLELDEDEDELLLLDDDELDELLAASPLLLDDEDDELDEDDTQKSQLVLLPLLVKSHAVTVVPPLASLCATEPTPDATAVPVTVMTHPAPALKSCPSAVKLPPTIHVQPFITSTAESNTNAAAKSQLFVVVIVWPLGSKLILHTQSR